MLFKEDKEWNACVNDDDTVNDEEDNKGYESDNWIIPLTKSEDEIFVTNKKLELVSQFFLKKIHYGILAFLKTQFDPCLSFVLSMR